MAAAIQTTATTLEGQMVEIARAMELAEQAVPEETRENRLSLEVDLQNAQIAVSVTFAATISGSGGTVSLSPVSYLP